MTSVLIVDDQSDLRLLVRTLITSANIGLTCTGEAACGEDALAFFDDGEATVVVLDQMMPGMTGIETARQILVRRPEQRIILFSAYVDQALVDEAASAGICTCVDKKDFGKLVSVVQQVAAA